MVESALINTLLGCLVGGVAGLIPGTGLLISLLAMYPYLLHLDLIGLLCFYIGLANVAQFTGSITAIHFGVPGESNSVPAVLEGHALAKQGLGHTAIVGTSLSSVTAGVLTLLLLIAMFPFYQSIFSWFYQTNNQLFIFVFALIVFLFASKNKWYITGLLMLAGYLLGKIGFNEFTGQYFLSFNNTDLKTGIPIFPILIAFLVVPNILKKYNFESIHNKKQSYKNNIILYFTNFKHSVLGTVVGFFSGLVPGVSTVLATNLSHKLSRYLDKTKGPSYKSLISAEASNNSAILVTLLPLVILGIPITGSEALLLSIMEMNLVEINWQIILDLNLHYLIASSVGISLFVGIMISWPMSQQLQKFIVVGKNYFKFIIIFALFLSMCFVASTTGQYFYYFITLGVASGLGVLLSRFDVLPFIFVFLIQKKLESVFIVSYNILT